jgi:hypothetical protein
VEGAINKDAGAGCSGRVESEGERWRAETEEERLRGGGRQ